MSSRDSTNHPRDQRRKPGLPRTNRSRSMAPATKVPFYEYDPESNAWETHRVARSQGDNAAPKLSLMTWNVWYEPVAEDFRFPAILRQIKMMSQEVDIIALQEVTPRFLAVLRHDEFVRKDWLITDRWDEAHKAVLGDTGYGIMFLVNRAMKSQIESRVIKFPTSKQGRYAQLIELSDAGDSTVISALLGSVNGRR